MRRGRKPRGLTIGLFVRIDKSLDDILEKRTKEERLKRPGVCVSKADLVREILWKALVP